MEKLQKDDILIVTADHGNDPVIGAPPPESGVSWLQLLPKI